MIDCPEYQSPRIIVKRDKVYETLGICKLCDKYCLLETGDKCDIYEEIKDES